MATYLLKRLLLIVPTLLGILLLNFILVHLAPGGPVEQMLAQLDGTSVDSTTRLGGGIEASASSDPLYSGAQGVSPQLIAEIEKLYGFDRPPAERFFHMIQSYLRFDLGKSYFRARRVSELLLERLPVSLTLGLWSTLLIYSISIPLGMFKAKRSGTSLDIVTSNLMIIGYAVPSFLLATLFLVLFANGSFWSIFPLRGLTSPGWENFSWSQKILDYLWHMALPVLTQTLGGFAALTFLTKNAFLEEIHTHYVRLARAKGLSEPWILFRHIFRNAMLVLVAGFPSAFLHIFFAGSLMIEMIFSLDGLGLLGFDAALTRDYPVIFGTLYIFTLSSLLLHIIGDLLYTWVDPRIHFDGQNN